MQASFLATTTIPIGDQIWWLKCTTTKEVIFTQAILSHFADIEPFCSFFQSTNVSFVTSTYTQNEYVYFYFYLVLEVQKAWK